MKLVRLAPFAIFLVLAVPAFPQWGDMMPLEEREALDAREASIARLPDEEPDPGPEMPRTAEERERLLHPCSKGIDECWAPGGTLYVRDGMAIPYYEVLDVFVEHLGDALAKQPQGIHRFIGALVGVRKGRPSLGIKPPHAIVELFRCFGHEAMAIMDERLRMWYPETDTQEIYDGITRQLVEKKARALAPLWLTFLDNLEDLRFDRQLLCAHIDGEVRDSMGMGGGSPELMLQPEYDLFADLVGEAGGAKP